jgi:tRNA(His) 5'-end guanylyltransferase
MEKKFEDTLGDRLKSIEQVEAGRRADPTKPLMARLDGRSFHTFTRGLARPYDERLSKLMIATTKYIVQQTHARLGYCQSDEMTFYWDIPDPSAGATFMFDGKYQKLCSILAGMASAYFTSQLEKCIPEKSHYITIFDARVWNVEDRNEVYLNYLWRQDDAIKNSISMAAQAHFSSKELHGVGSEAKKQMLREIGYPWEQEPDFFKWGSYLKRQKSSRKWTEEELLSIPEGHRPPSVTVTRSLVEEVDLGYIKNSADARFIFGTCNNTKEVT